MPPAPPSSPTHHPARAPDRGFWLDELYVARFREIVKDRDPAAIDRAFNERWNGNARDRAAAARILGSFGDTPHVRLNLVLLDEFMQDKLQTAILDVGRIAIGDEQAADHPAFEGRGHRGSAAALIYETDPALLLGVELLDQWHPRHRRAYRLEGQRRTLPQDIDGIDWPAVSEQALGAIGRFKGRLVFGRALHRPWERDLLLAFRDRGALDTGRDEDGLIQPVYKDAWTILRFHDQLHRVDVTASNPDRGASLAGAVASAIWKAKRVYVPARDPLSRARLDEFLGRVIDPDDDVFKLLEVTAEVVGRWRRPIVRVGNTGRERVEQVVQDLAHLGYARSSTSVHRVKLGFDDEGRHYRIELHFPPAAEDEGDLVLSYGDRGWSKSVATKFEALVQAEVGVEIHPKAPRPGGPPGRPQRHPPRPQRLDAAVWADLLQPRIDDPAPWQRAELQKLHDAGLLRCEDQAVFRCGDPHIPGWFRPPGTLDCPGEVVMPFGAVSAHEPFLQEPGSEFACSDCGARWRIGGFHPPAWQRAVVSIDPAEAWKRVVEGMTAKRYGYRPGPSGVLSRVDDEGETRYVVCPQLAEEKWGDPGRGAYNPICWFGVARSDVDRYGARGVDLARYLGGGAPAIQTAIDLGTDDAAPMLAAEPPPGPPRRGPRPPTPDLAVRLVQPSDDGIYVGEMRVAAREQQAVHFLFALLQAATAQESAPTARKRGFHPAGALAALADGANVEAKDIHQWVLRAREGIDKAFGRPGLGKEIIESGGKKGIRIGPGFECREFDLQGEVAAYKERQRKP